MVYMKTCGGGGPALSQEELLVVLGCLFLLLVWRTVRPPERPRWSISGRCR